MNKQQFLTLLEQSIERRSSLRTLTNAMRLVNGLGDGMNGLVLDRYDRHFHLQVFEMDWIEFYPTILEYLKNTFDAQYLIIKDRTASPSSQPEAFQTQILLDSGSSETIVEEYGRKFAVNLNDTLNTGLFLDMRRNRHMVGQLCNGRKVLNCFAYSCSFGVHCRAGGAASVVNVDVSPKCLERGKTNYALNAIAAAANEFIRADAVEYLERAVKKDNRFDLIILDPPSFARYKGQTFSIKHDLSHLIECAISVLNPQGILFVSTNYSMIGHEQLEGLISDECELRSRHISKLERLGQDEDFVGSGLIPESHLAAVLATIDD